MFTRDQLLALVAEVQPADAEVAAATQQRLDDQTKPPGSLGKLEALAVKVCAARRDPSARSLHKAIVVMAADHGVAAEGVSAYPQAVTAQMLHNFAAGGAAINVLARHAGAALGVVDMGVREPPPPLPRVASMRVGPGTRNFAQEPAMTHPEVLTAIGHGVRVARDALAVGSEVIGIGEMGIGNTTSATAILCALTGADPRQVTGRGTGIDDPTRQRKVGVITHALALHRLDARDPLAVLQHVGGFELAGLVGVALAAGAGRALVLVDGFIASAAALVAARLCPALTQYVITSHRSLEPGHGPLLEALGQEPLLDLSLRLGEGTGAALSMPLIDAALAILQDMATFESAAVSRR